MRIGKKTSKEVTFKPDLIEGVTRLICTCKGVISHASSVAEPTDAPVGRCIDIAPPSSSSPLHQQSSLPPPHLSAGELAPAVVESTVVRHPFASSSVRDDLSYGFVIPGQSASSSGDQVFVRSKWVPFAPLVCLFPTSIFHLSLCVYIFYLNIKQDLLVLEASF